MARRSDGSFKEHANPGTKPKNADAWLRKLRGHRGSAPDVEHLEELSKPLESGEFDQLDAWLLSDDSPENCMDVSMLHGFLTALVSGPLTMPSEWLPVVWGAETASFKSLRDSKWILGLIMRLNNEIANELLKDTHRFQPLFYENRLAEPPAEIADEWCFGYMRGVNLRHGEWSWLFDEPEYRELFAPLFAMAYFEGEYKFEYERVHADDAMFQRTKALIAPSIGTIYKLWRARESGALRRPTAKN